MEISSAFSDHQYVQDYQQLVAVHHHPTLWHPALPASHRNCLMDQRLYDFARSVTLTCGSMQRRIDLIWWHYRHSSPVCRRPQTAYANFGYRRFIASSISSTLSRELYTDSFGRREACTCSNLMVISIISCWWCYLFTRYVRRQALRQPRLDNARIGQFTVRTGTFKICWVAFVPTSVWPNTAARLGPTKAVCASTATGWMRILLYCQWRGVGRRELMSSWVDHRLLCSTISTKGIKLSPMSRPYRSLFGLALLARWQRLSGPCCGSRELHVHPAPTLQCNQKCTLPVRLRENKHPLCSHTFNVMLERSSAAFEV